MKIYKLTWYLTIEDTLKEALITDRDFAEQLYLETKKALYRGCWLSLSEMVENEEHILIGGEGLHYNDI